MKTISIFVLLKILVIFSLSSQNLEIKGMLQDSSENPLVAASVMLLEPDSSLVEFTESSLDGSFAFKKIHQGRYMIKFNYVGYLPLTLPLERESGKIDLGTIKMAEIDTRLMEVVIKAAKAPMTIRGDTIEYDASQFKVPQGSTLEDLLRRLPGVIVDRDGNIRAEGMNVTRLTVEGKTFFSDDPRMATKNLPAEGISKVQVFDRKSEEQRLIADKSVAEEKEMNVLLKDEFKKGGFGRVTAGSGDIERKELKGNYNRFDTKQQFSVIGVGNNTGRNGLGWDDYEDFTGSNSGFQSFGLDYGFIGTYSWGINNQDEMEANIYGAFIDNNRGGFPSTFITGVSYNYDHNKNQLSARYLFKRQGNLRNSLASSQSFLPGQTSLTQSNSDFDDLSKAHRFEIMYRRELDSLTSVFISAGYNDAYKQSITERYITNLFDNNIPVSENTNLNNVSIDGNVINAIAVLRRRFKKKGRFLGLNTTISTSNLNDRTQNDADQKFFNTISRIDSLSMIRQRIVADADKIQIKTNLMITEPLNKLFFIQSFYNFRTWAQQGNFLVKDNENNNANINISLSRDYENGVTAQRAGTSLKFTKSGFNASMGYGYQISNLKGVFTGVENSQLDGNIQQNFGAWVTHNEVSYEINRSTQVSIKYSKTVEEPQLRSLLPLINNLNPLFIEIGNQDLLPEVVRQAQLYFRTAWPAQGINIYTSASFKKFETQIIQKQTVDKNLVTISQPINFDGGSSWNGYFNFSAPVIVGKIRTRLYASFNRGETFSIINDVVNNTISTTYSPQFNIDLTFTDKFALFTGGSFSTTDTKYDINKGQNQKIISYSYNAQLNLNPIKGFFISSRIVHSFYRNDRFGSNFDVPTLNLSLSKQILKGNRGEIRLSMYDAFDQNRQISQFASLNFVSESVTTALARYFMLSFTYNIRGVNISVSDKQYN